MLVSLSVEFMEDLQYIVRNMYGSNCVSNLDTPKVEYLFIDTNQNDPDGKMGHRLDLLETATGDKVFDFRFNFNQSIEVGTNTIWLAPGNTYKTIKSIELCSFSISTTLQTRLQATTNSYIILDIDELNGRINSNSDIVNGVFAILYLEEGKCFYKGRDFFEKIKYYDPPMSVLSAMNVKIREQNGNTLKALTNEYVTMMFKITSFK